ncbi:putative Diguanylate cyclase [Sterolibacterium denitrificans]|uniref:Diguanylate cyclase n=1 Tax=Sterolibacterium denitrificans TaxID=157592 RepID=A0A7Z7HT31_9PROT|nr:PAS domain S-box protein [Sterolibacterium denitrificans]SMB30018.1 putative Diguanylate cyclase [Sterolibacterium denitrificans]
MSAAPTAVPYPVASAGRRLIAIALLAAIYAAVGVGSFRLFHSAGILPIIWVPDGIVLAAMLLMGGWLWPGVFLGSLATMLISGFPVFEALGLAAISAFNVLFCHAALRHVWKIDIGLGALRDFFALVWTAAISALLSALLGSTVLYLSGSLNGAVFGLNFAHWWQGVVLGLVLVTPLILTFRNPLESPLSLRWKIECALCLLLAVVFGQVILVGWRFEPLMLVVSDNWMFLFATWAAASCGRRAVMLIVTVFAVQGLIGAFSGQGFYAADLEKTGLMQYWFLVILSCCIGAALSILLFERRQKSAEIAYALQYSEDVLRSLPGIFYLIDMQGRLLRWNPAYADIVGYTNQELVGISVLELIAEEDRALVAARMADVFTHGEAQVDAGLLIKSGQVIPYHFTGRRTMLEGQPCLIGLGQDISERVRIRQAIEDSEARYRLLFERNLANTLIIDPAGIILMINENNARVLGGTVEDFVGKSLYTLMPAERAEIYRQRFAEILATNDDRAYEDAFDLPEGEHWFASRLSPAIDAHGQVYGIQLVAFDITERKRAESALRESELKYRQLIENATTFVTIFDGDGIIKMMNQANARMFGVEPEELIGKSLHELDPEHAEQFIERYRSIMASGESMTTEDPFPLPDGLHWFRAHLSPMFDSHGQAVAVQVVAFDITERRNTEDALRRSEALWKFALEGAGDAVWELDIPGWHSTFSPRWQQMLGYGPDEVVDNLHDWMSRVHPEDQHDVANTLEAMLSSRISTTSNEVRVLCKDGSWKWVLMRSMVTDRDAGGRPLRLVGTCADISIIKEHQYQLEHLAHFDMLTDLPNRVLLGRRLQQAMAQTLRRGQSLAVAYLDLDGFKEVNDAHSHQVGDELLVMLAQRMQETLREGDTLARIGGDEFVAILTDLDEPQDCMPVLNRLLNASSQPVPVGRLLLSVSASIGVTLFPGDGGDADQLVRHADQAMYQAKQSGKNRIHLFDVRHDSAIQAQHETISNIRHGLRQGEFVLYYQPKVNMKTGALIGVEALIRWLHPERGLIPPIEFLPIIENQEVSLELGEWVIDRALIQIGQWQEAGLAVPVSVNISAHQLQQGNFSDRLGELLARHPLVDHTLLELEILETGAIDDLPQVIRFMKSCQALGIRFSIDDFGTGYSSLSYLKRLPEAVLKIDQSFIRDMLEDPDDLAIAEGVIGLARVFRREIIAEGVETVAHGELLLQLGCHLAQGYGIARPMPADDLPHWAASWQPDDRWLAWSEIPYPNPDTSLVLAEVRHRRWLRSIGHQIEGIVQDDGALLHQPGPLAVWLQERGAKYRGKFAEFEAIEALYEQIQRLAQDAVAAHADGKEEKARMMVDRLHELNEKLISLLHTMALGYAR